jgi:two-component system, cell cycle sensor histidine kinase and response regulator CckA
MSKILLVEDDEAEQRLYINILKSEGFDVVLLANGQDCHNKVVEEKPDLILLDVMMPKMNGFETLDVLQFDSETKKVPVIILTNLSDPHYEEEALRHGAVKFLIKSQTENKQLVRIIQDVIQAFGPKATGVTS